MSTRLFTEERSVILEPLKAHRCRLIRDKEEFEPVTRASEIMLTAEEPSIRTYFCAKNIVMDYICSHPNDPRGFMELGKVHLFSCAPENLDLAEEAFRRVQSLSGHIHAEAWYLWSMCYRIRLFGHGPTSKQAESERKTTDIQERKRYLRLTEKGLKLALKHSNGSNIYRFALSEFYTSTQRVSKALSTLQCGISSSQRTHTDGAIFHQLGRFGISCINGLWERGRQDKAKQVGMGALEYYRQAIEIGGNNTEEWKAELTTAEGIVDQLVEQTSDLADFSTEPDFHPSGPTSLRRWLTASPVPTQQVHDSSPARRADFSRQSPTASSEGLMENLTEFLDRIENQAETYQDGGVDSLTENSRWLHIPSRPSEPRFLPSQAGPSTNYHSRSWVDLGSPTNPLFVPTTCSTVEQKLDDLIPLSHDSRELTSQSILNDFDDEPASPSFTCSIQTSDILLSSSRNSSAKI